MKKIPFAELRSELLKHQIDAFIDLKADDGLDAEEFAEQIANCHVDINGCEDVHDLLDYLYDEGYHGEDGYEFLVSMMIEEIEHIGRADQ